MPPPLTDAHKVLIQALLSRGPLAEEEFHSIFSGVTGKNPGRHQELFNDYLLKINKELSYINCELRACRNQNDGKVFYGFVNNVADEESKLGTKYSVPQIAFYKGIVEAIIQDATAQGSISVTDALNVRLENQIPPGGSSQSQESLSSVPAAFRNFSLSQKDKTLEELLRDKWFCPIANGRVGLGIRSFLDLRGWFRNNEVPSCEVCSEAAVKAELCPNENCTVRIHAYCLRRRSPQRRVKKVCPSCDTEWKFQVPNAEEEEEEEADVPVALDVQSQPSSGAKRKRLHGSTSRAGEGVGPVCSQPPPHVSDERRVTRRSARLR